MREIVDRQVERVGGEYHAVLYTLDEEHHRVPLAEGFGTCVEQALDAAQTAFEAQCTTAVDPCDFDSMLPPPQKNQQPAASSNSAPRSDHPPRIRQKPDKNTSA